MKKSNVIGLTVGIVVTIVVVSLISWFAIRPVPTRTALKARKPVKERA